MGPVPKLVAGLDMEQRQLGHSGGRGPSRTRGCGDDVVPHPVATRKGPRSWSIEGPFLRHGFLPRSLRGPLQGTYMRAAGTFVHSDTQIRHFLVCLGVQVNAVVRVLKRSVGRVQRGAWQGEPGRKGEGRERG